MYNRGIIKVIVPGLLRGLRTTRISRVIGYLRYYLYTRVYLYTKKTLNNFFLGRFLFY